MSSTRDLLLSWLSARLSSATHTWLTGRADHLAAQFTPRALYLAFGAVPRRVGDVSLNLTSAETDAALAAGFDPTAWDVVQTARTALLLSVPAPDAEAYLTTLRPLFDTGAVSELVALYAALPLLPFPAAWRAQAAEGVRTNMTPVFDAVALRNPYPASHFDEAAWNQLYLKAAFMGRPLHQIVGVARRANATLARVVSDYARERWAAGRAVVPAFWRPVGPFLTEERLPDVERLLKSAEPAARAAGALLCAESNLPAARALPAAYPAAPNLATLRWEDLPDTLG